MNDSNLSSRDQKKTEKILNVLRKSNQKMTLFLKTGC